MYVFFLIFSIGHNKSTSVSTQAIQSILETFASNYISKWTCPTDKMQIPLNEIKEISNQIDEIVLRTNLIPKEKETFSISEGSLRNLAYEAIRSRCIRGEQLVNSFKRLDQVYHLDNAETEEALKSKVITREICCVPSCRCYSLMMKDIITRFPTLIKIKLNKFVAELKVLDGIVLNLLLKSPAVTNEGQARKKESKRLLVLQRSGKVEKKLLKRLIEALIRSKKCENVTFVSLIRPEVISKTSDELAIEKDKNLSSRTKSNTTKLSNPSSTTKIIAFKVKDVDSKSMNNIRVSENVTDSLVSNFTTPRAKILNPTLLVDATKVNTIKSSKPFTPLKTPGLSHGKNLGNNIMSSNREVSTKSSTLESKTQKNNPPTTNGTKLKNSGAETSVLLTNVSNSARPSLSLDTVSSPSPLGGISATISRTTQRQGGFINRTPVRNSPTTSQATTTTTKPILTTQTVTTTAPKRRFNPFLRNVFGRG